MFRLISSIIVVVVVLLLYAVAAKFDDNPTDSQPSTPPDWDIDSGYDS